ncbi:MAG TPA: uroporphyrinogen-III synthase [Beijerinckiaceae bacterium]|nr:uroporphyrinogen-III synthase [Beijerinckiaceae bacterium]
MRILVLRPAAEGARTAERIRSLGGEPVLAPLVEIAPTGVRAPAWGYDGLIATSAHAFEFLGEDFEALRDLPLFVVGARTESAARKRGFSSIAAVAPDADALAERLLRSMEAGQRALYLAGTPRRPELEQLMGDAGVSVDAPVVYEARAAISLPEAAARGLREGALEAALHYSARSAALFVALAQSAGLLAQASRLVHAALSANAAEPLRAIASDLRIAKRPEEASLIELLRL